MLGTLDFKQWEYLACNTSLTVIAVFKRLAYTQPLTVMGPNLWRDRMLRQSATYGTKYIIAKNRNKQYTVVA